jgi:hypothetical protein
MCTLSICRLSCITTRSWRDTAGAVAAAPYAAAALAGGEVTLVFGDGDIAEQVPGLVKRGSNA